MKVLIIHVNGMIIRQQAITKIFSLKSLPNRWKKSSLNLSSNLLSLIKRFCIKVTKISIIKGLQYQKILQK